MTMPQQKEEKSKAVKEEVSEDLTSAKSNPVDDIRPQDSVSNKLANGEANKKDTEIKKDSSFIKAVEREGKSMSSREKSTVKKKIKNSILISYSPDAGFIERKFVVETVRQLKENNLAEDIWFDKDERNTDSPCWFSQRMEAVERCRAALIFLSDSYLLCPVSLYEGRALCERLHTDPESVKIFTVMLGPLERAELPRSFSQLMNNVVDLSPQQKLSLAERSSHVVGSFMEDLEKCASVHAPPRPETPPDSEFTGNYRTRKICQWSAGDLQEWLFRLGIKEFYRQSMAENMVDGFLLMAINDTDLSTYLGIDSRVVRRKILQQILSTLEREHKLSDSWHLRARTVRTRVETVYLVYDPTDVRLAQSLIQDLKRKGLIVSFHDKLGKSKEEFLEINGPRVATATHVLILLTDAASNSLFVFHEVLFADWLGKKIVTLMFKNAWTTLRPSLKAVLGELPAIDFETRLYTESMDVLEHHIRPLRRVPGVVLEQSYLNKMADGLKPLQQLAQSNVSHSLWSIEEQEPPRVFLSYQWDMQTKVEELRRYLESQGLACWADLNTSMTRGNSSISSRSGQRPGTQHADVASETLANQIQKSMRQAALVICCITPRYVQSDSCVKDLTLAETLHKPILPLLLRFTPWPPENASPKVKKILARSSAVDLSNDKLFRQNLSLVVDRATKLISKPS